MSEPVYIPGQDFFAAGTEMDPPSNSFGRSYREQDDRTVRWMNGQDVIAPSVGPTDYPQNMAGPNSPGSSLHNGAPPLNRENASTVSSWGRKTPSGMQYRPDFPPSSSLVWDVLETQDTLLKPYAGPKVRPAGFRSNWALPLSLEDLTPPLLLGERMICNSITDAEAVYDCLARNSVIKQNKVYSTPSAKQLEEMLKRTPVVLNERKLKQLEWIVGLLFDLRKFNPEQFQEIHDGKELVFAPLWDSYFAGPWGGLGSLLGWRPSSTGKGRSASKVYVTRLDYWNAERRWQEDVWGPEYRAQIAQTTARAASPTSGLVTPKSSPSLQRSLSSNQRRRSSDTQSSKTSTARSTKTDLRASRT